MLFEVLAQLSLEFPHVRQQILDAAVLADEFAGGLFANAGDTRDVVRHIAPQADDVDHLFGPFHTPLRANFRKTKDFGGVAHAAGFVDEVPFGNELPEVFVRCHQVGFEALLFGASNERADDVVGLVAIANQGRDVKGFEQSSDMRQSPDDVLRHRFALDFVFGELAVPFGRRFGVEGDGDVRGLLIRENVQQRVGKDEQRRRIDTFRREDGAADEREVRAVNQRHAIEQEKPFLHAARLA